jgi:hypothetical protein
MQKGIEKFKNTKNTVGTTGIKASRENVRLGVKAKQFSGKEESTKASA